MHQLSYLGDLAPVRNSAPGSKTYDYVREDIKLRKWAQQKYGTHKEKDADNYLVPRIVRRDAVTMVKWWKNTIGDITGSHQLHREVREGFMLMEIGAYRTVDAATGKVKLTEAELAEELSWPYAESFWRGMRIMSVAIGPAKMVPTLFDRGILLLESFGEAAAELPGRIVDTAKGAIDVAKDVKSGVDKAITAIKWVGIAGAGVVGIYVITRVLPARPSHTTREKAS